VRAKYIVAARRHAGTLKERVRSFETEHDAREWLVGNVKGLGYKEASHFLRNIGFDGVAIVDFHIVDFLEGYKLVKKPKSMTKKRYLEIEKVLEDVASKSGMTLAELDLYMWYCETGKILK
jgi:N-glycosylase/DNA lyase